MKLLSLITPLFNKNDNTTLYSYYYLASQNWCSADYKIHGLWADITSTDYPSYCSDVAFDLAELQTSTRYDELLVKWFDCTYDETISLYEHEWSKHGTCIALQSGMTQNEFFEKTLDLFVAYNNGSDPVCFDLEFNQMSCFPPLGKVEPNI